MILSTSDQNKPACAEENNHRVSKRVEVKEAQHCVFVGMSRFVTFAFLRERFALCLYFVCFSLSMPPLEALVATFCCSTWALFSFRFQPFSPIFSCDVYGLCWVRSDVESPDDQSCHEDVHCSYLHCSGVLRRS